MGVCKEYLLIAFSFMLIGMALGGNRDQACSDTAWEMMKHRGCSATMILNRKA